MFLAFQLTIAFRHLSIKLSLTLKVIAAVSLNILLLAMNHHALHLKSSVYSQHHLREHIISPPGSSLNF